LSKKNNILLLGTTGRTGALVLQVALDKGYTVRCLSRNSNRIEARENLTILEGDPSIKSDLENAIEGCDYVISVLNISRTSDYPWARLRTPETYLSDVMGLLVSMAEEKGVKRIIMCSAWGVGDSYKTLPSWFKWFINNSNLKPAYRDHEKQENIISKSDLNWTIVRPVGLTNSMKNQSVRDSISADEKPNSIMISRNSVAKYLVKTLKNDALIAKKVVICKE